MDNKQKSILKYVIFSFLATVSLKLSLTPVSVESIEKEIGMKNTNAIFRLLWDFKRSLSGYNIESVILIVALAFLFYRISKYITRFYGSVAVVSLIFTFFEIFGYSFKCDNSWDYVFATTRNVIKAIVSAIGYEILFYYLICGIMIFSKNMHLLGR